MKHLFCEQKGLLETCKWNIINAFGLLEEGLINCNYSVSYITQHKTIENIDNMRPASHFSYLNCFFSPVFTKVLMGTNSNNTH